MKSLTSLLLIGLSFLFFGCSTNVDPDQETVTENQVLLREAPEGTPSLLFVDIEEKTLNRFDLETYQTEYLFDVPNGPSGVLAYDRVDQFIYYTDYGNESILRNRLDGSDEQTVVKNAPDIRSMVLDVEKRKLFFTTYSSIEIKCFDLNDSTITTAIQGPGFSSYGNLQDMELVNGGLYSITPVQNKESVFRATLEDNSIQQVLNYDDAGYGYGIGVDEVNEYIFFNNVEEAAIMRSDLQGNEIVKVVSLDKVRVYGIVADGIEEKLYWTTWGNQLGISNLDGSDPMVFNIQGASRNLIKVYLPD